MRCSLLLNATAAMLLGRAAFEVGSLPPDKKIPILVYCEVGGRSARAADALRRLGYTDVINGGGRDAVMAHCNAT
jgi:rhodanese-related sulfurtransferase